MNIIIIGTGRMGFAQARLARSFGDTILCAVEIDQDAGNLFSNEFHVPVYHNVTGIANYTPELIFITVYDKAIETVARELHDIPRTCIVMHTSGALSSDILSRHIDVPCASYHPLMSCPLTDVSDRKCLETYHGVLHCVEGHPTAINTARLLVQRLGGQCAVIRTSCKAAYHAAAVFASNYPVILIHSAIEILVQCGFTRKQAKAASLRLLHQAALAMEHADPVDALTGPAKRRDIQTIDMHRNALQQFPDLLNLYESLLHATNLMCQYPEDTQTT